MNYRRMSQNKQFDDINSGVGQGCGFAIGIISVPVILLLSGALFLLLCFIGLFIIGLMGQSPPDTSTLLGAAF